MAFEVGAEIVVMLALAAYTLRPGQQAPRFVRWNLLVFCLLLAASAIAGLVAGQQPYPEPPARGPNGCPVEFASTTGYWQSQLRLRQLAELLRCGALVCAIRVTRTLPGRLPRRHGVIALIVVLVVITVPIGVFPFFSASDGLALLVPTAPGLLTFTAAVVLVVLSLTRAVDRAADRAGLIAGAVLILGTSSFAVEGLAELHHQLPDPEVVGAMASLQGCLYATATVSVTWSFLNLVAAALSLAGPVLLVRSLSDHGRHGPHRRPGRPE